MQTEIPSVPTQSQGTMSPINAHHTGKARKTEEIGTSQASTSLSNLKSLRSPVKKTGLQLYQEDIVPSTKD